VPPVNCAGVAVKSLRKSSCGCRAELLVKRLRMFKPSLEIRRRCFHNDGRMESITIHGGDLVGRQIINHAQVVLPVWVNVDVSADPVLKREPGHRIQQGILTSKVKKLDLT